VYPGQGQQREGRLTPEAMRLLAANPDRLLAFDQLRALVHLTMGNELFLLTPVSVLCPLHGRTCMDGGRLLLSTCQIICKLWSGTWSLSTLERPAPQSSQPVYDTRGATRTARRLS
jgi:hypothetical protein